MDRPANQIREVSIERHYLKSSPGSVLYRCGETVVLCTASVSTSLPKWREGSGKGWVTAEYNMLPHSTSSRKQRDRGGKVDGRTTEIQRLIGRSLRAVVDLEALGELAVNIDCDVLQADGGTRTASITGGFIALVDAVESALPGSQIGDGPIRDYVAAISSGVIENEVYLDLDYRLDSAADVDMNIVMTGAGRFVELQGTGEEATFDNDQLTQLLGLGKQGIDQLIGLQKQALQR
ncbi:ribonuclease PH [Rosistilla oblonga]|uniref:ribonuclease PH n=1 Tax=Rosistilla oblonga TaxID=2527990 RepID=UPI003A97E6FA